MGWGKNSGKGVRHRLLKCKQLLMSRGTHGLRTQELRRANPETTALALIGVTSLPLPYLSLDATARLHEDLLAVVAQFNTQVRVLVPQRVVLKTQSKAINDCAH